MKFESPVPPQSNLGRDADPKKKTDNAFYDWVKGKDENASIENFFLSLVDEFKEEDDTKAVGELLQDWKKGCTPEELEARMRIFSRLLPPQHPFHKLKADIKK